MSLGKIAAGPGAARYYTDQVARGQEDYYAGQKEEPGQWVGAGAAVLGWEGEVDADVFAHLLGGAGLRRPPKTGGVVGIDLTFRAPKSVSVLWAVGPEELGDELRTAHVVAVQEALGYLEREACWARRGAGGKVQVRGGGFVGAAFMHRASRAGDPLLHTHVVVGNLTQGPDGRWTALDARHLYRQAKTAGYLYQAVLRAEITERTGLDWAPVEHGVADLVVVPREVVEHFSQRRREILEHMAEHGGRSAASAQVAALETRRAKGEPPLARQRTEWRARASEHGLTPDRVADLAGQTARRDAPRVQAINPEVLTEQASTFGRPELLQALAEAQPAGARVADLEQLAATSLDDRGIVRLRDGIAAASITERRYSTRDLLRIERDLIDGALRRRGCRVAVAPAVAIERAGDGRGLTSDQRALVDGLCGRGDGVAVVRAAAGTGKTFALDAAREAWESAGIPVRGCALSARAALELSDQAAIESVTIAALRNQLDRGWQLPARSVLVVDEAGMVGTRALADLAAAAQVADAKLVLVGDDRQLPEIQAGGAFRALAERLDAIELREVRRQEAAWDRSALDALRSGEVDRWARAYRERGRITVADNARDTRAALVNDWSQAGGDALMIAARRDDVADLNHRARELRQARGDLGPDELSSGGRRWAQHDRVIATRNDRQAGILNGERGTIVAIDHQHRSLDVELDSGRHVELGDTYLRPGHLDHGYAITAHRAQGATVDRTFVLGSEELYREWGYTALSRHRREARFYVARPDLESHRDAPPEYDPVVSGITRLLERSRAQQLALDSLSEAGRDALEAEDRRVRAALQADPPPRRPTVNERDLARADAAVEAAAAAGRELVDERDALRWFDRRRHQTLGQRIARNDAWQAREREHRDELAAEHDRQRAADEQWLERHGPDTARLLAVTRELDDRNEIETTAERRLSAITEPTPSDRPHHGPYRWPVNALLDRDLDPPDIGMPGR
ncbi:relaxase domain-containing protein [Paraconexibacter antarcticus]|uniref:Relaxase domain-containing protein n=1 Tax=Paraconexibacter antarcticus TaxID=2949664 RepID=A0ABY5DKN4_9ACTN|nr:MobF family relaxase [Paraconexibacter antarcticus]UTI62283.1 relaxase domain-containing protein [Paraconexibacter antarcticus]